MRDGFGADKLTERGRGDAIAGTQLDAIEEQFII